MKLAILCLMSILATGCNSAVPTKVAQESPAPALAEVAVPTPEPESREVTALRAEAKRRGLKWSISCHNNSHDGVEYCAWAVQTDKFGGYIEDGAKPSWFKYDLPSQETSAVWLIKAIQGQPNDIPTHKPKEYQKPVSCNSSIGGER